MSSPDLDASCSSAGSYLTSLPILGLTSFHPSPEPTLDISTLRLSSSLAMTVTLALIYVEIPLAFDSLFHTHVWTSFPVPDYGSQYVESSISHTSARVAWYAQKPKSFPFTRYVGVIVFGSTTGSRVTQSARVARPGLCEHWGL